MTAPGQQDWSRVTAWSVMEPHADAVEIHEGPQVFLRGFEKVPGPVGHLIAVWWCDSEVCNGGFHQFFSNSTGILAPEAAAGFRAIGLNDCAEIVEQAIEMFGEPYPRTRADREAVLATLLRPGTKREQ